MKDDQLFTQQMIRQLMKAQLHDGAEQEQSQTITIESKTFNRVLLYILMHESHLTEEQKNPVEESLMNKLDGVLKENKSAFENMLDFLDKKM